MDMLGNVIGAWHAANRHVPMNLPEGSIAVPIDSMHHEVSEMPSGNLLTLSTEVRNYPSYPSSGNQRGCAAGSGERHRRRGVEFARDGTVVGQWPLLDSLDPMRIGYGSLTGFWNARGYADIAGGTKDWTHSNAVIYSEKDDSFLVSARHQDAIVKFSRATGTRTRISARAMAGNAPWGDELLGPIGSGYAPIYHQHAPELTDEGNVLLFYNGDFQAHPFVTPLAAASNHSRAVEYAIDETLRTVRQSLELW